ncbi:hypothetical protein [Blastococcus saxobsidens]|uniref:Uncharacterized protein n=1 Tax=Blastococcus saxobsidens (strain DD2) TaxID=1146883 RepID=H6RU64_BLASD|nr:hypothetical protein [Blastococcus saxobsidens]CCG05671.1 conserved membrane protein of unknown function, putative permease domain [Blastococcus saxobsidens DD2]
MTTKKTRECALRPTSRHSLAWADARWRAAVPFLLLGFAAIIAGGLVAAVTGPTGFTDGSWVAAYLVLVAGVAQLGLGVGQALLAAVLPSGRLRGLQFAMYNGANAGVLIGTLTDVVPVVMVGGGLLLGACALFLSAVRHTRARPWQLRVYQSLLAILAVSVPVGLTLSALGSG